MGTVVRAMKMIMGGTGAALSFGAGVVFAGAPVPPPNYGHSFVTVGAPGNRGALESERFYSTSLAVYPNLGQVNYEYRISRTETTIQQWYDFVRAAWPTAYSMGVTENTQAFTGGSIYTNQPGLNAVWQISPGTNNLAVPVSFRFAAWYCNYLHNGAPTTNITAGTFLTGAYTVDGDSVTRNPGALYWIPSLDEWTKAGYYDPNRYGLGQEGYWKHPGMSDVPLVGGPPGTPGAQTSAGSWHQGVGLPPNVGSYPSVQSPWGLFDTSGGQTEYTDTFSLVLPGWRILRGEDLGGGASLTRDRIDHLTFAIFPGGGGFGFRLASVVPSTGVSIVLVGWPVFATHRRRRAMT